MLLVCGTQYQFCFVDIDNMPFFKDVYIGNMPFFKEGKMVVILDEGQMC
jgi:hypothetical protein